MTRVAPDTLTLLVVKTFGGLHILTYLNLTYTIPAFLEVDRWRLVHP